MPNEEFRTGPSASLPDCRAYEFVTPEELGRTQAMTFTTSDHAIPSPDGEHLALQTYAPLEPRPSLVGTRAVYSRTPYGWTAKSIVSPEVDARELDLEAGAFSPNLSQVAFQSIPTLNEKERKNTPDAYEVGPVGGPYTAMADVPSTSESGFLGTFVAGANAGTASVPSFTDVLFESADHQLLPKGPEATVAGETEPGRFVYDLYDWTEGRLRLINVEGEGANVKMLNACGDGRLGAGATVTTGPGTIGAVPADGSKIFFESCGRLYMRVDDRETVEVSAPAPGVVLNPSERVGVSYDAASVDGSEVVFNTGTPLLEGETDNEDELLIYNTITRELKLISTNGIPVTRGTGGSKVLVSEDGSAVYYEAGGNIYRYATQSGQTSFIAAISEPVEVGEPSYTTPNGQVLVFVSGPGGVKVAGPHGLELEPRGAGHNELYRYDAADGSVMCVSCGEGMAPAEGEMIEPGTNVLSTMDETPPFIPMSEDGRRVFFQTTAQLVPQDTNNPTYEGSSAGGSPGMDVYEWEADDTEESPDVFCHILNGCTHLISTGEDVGKATFLGASENGKNIFFATAGQLVTQVDPEFPNIYDARVDGGFPPQKAPPPCLSCQGVGNPPPLFNTPASGTFTGAANPVTPPSTTTPVAKTKTVKCKKGLARKRPNVSR